VPFGARDPGNPKKQLNPYLAGDGYASLECPADRGGDPKIDATWFAGNGTSYVYCSGSSDTGQGISALTNAATALASKKVCVLEYDATLSFAAPAARESCPKAGKGFWHGYRYVRDPAQPTDRSKYRVKCHATFLDGHAEPIELNKYSAVDPESHDYY
jgi:hypothetical protein